MAPVVERVTYVAVRVERAVAARGECRVVGEGVRPPKLPVGDYEVEYTVEWSDGSWTTRLFSHSERE